VEVLLLRVQEKKQNWMRCSFVQSKQQRWLWQTVDHVTADVLAYVLDTHEDTAFLQLKALLAPFGLSILHGRLGAYERHLEERQHTIGKRYTKKIERETFELSHSD